MTRVIDILWLVVGAGILLAALFILIRRLIAFIRTKGRSACENCPYSKSCQGECGKTKR